MQGESSVTDEPLDDPTLQHSQLNPKFGFIWQVAEGTTLRAAAFRTFTRPTSLRQTIEPTEVAGFNQFFDDFFGTDAWRYGIGLDQSFGRSVFAGLEYSERDLDIPTRAFGQIDSDEQLGRAYLYWAATSRLAVSSEYRFESLKEDLRVNTFLVAKADTHRFPLAIHYFHPSGLFGQLRLTYLDQNGEFINQFTGEVVPGNDNFWVTDFALGYRFPRRLGIASIEVRNLFDQDFRFQDSDPANTTISKNASVFARLTLTF
jgi:outer membrane receptor protein involved in Fe transport